MKLPKIPFNFVTFASSQSKVPTRLLALGLRQFMKMKILIFKVFCLLFVAHNGSAQDRTATLPTAFLTGKIRGAKTSEVLFVYRSSPMQLRADTIRTILDIKKNFTVRLVISQATEVEMICEGSRLSLYLQSNDSLFFASKAPELVANASFLGRGADNNKCWQAVQADYQKTNKAPQESDLESLLSQADAAYQATEGITAYKTSKEFRYFLHSALYWKPLHNFLATKSALYNEQTQPLLARWVSLIYKNAVEEQYLSMNLDFAFQWHYLLYAYFCRSANNPVQHDMGFYHFLKSVPDRALSESMLVYYALFLKEDGRLSVLEEFKNDLRSYLIGAEAQKIFLTHFP